jgi:hypothetical protein
MSKGFSLPGVFWVAVFVAVVPAVAGVIEQYYPAAEYPWVVAVLTGLAAIAKSLELAFTRPPKPEPLINVAPDPGIPTPAAAPLAPAEPSPTLPFWFELLFGRR